MATELSIIVFGPRKSAGVAIILYCTTGNSFLLILEQVDIVKESMRIERKMENLMKEEFPKLILKNQILPARTGKFRYSWLRYKVIT